MKLPLPGRAASVVADQAVSSVSNLALTLIVAAEVDSVVFGEYSLVIAAYLFAVAIGQALVGEPLLVATAVSRDGRRLARSSLGAALCVGAAGGGLLFLASLAVDGALRGGLLVLGACLPMLLMQDAARFVAFARQRGSAALAGDLTWAIAQILATLAVLQANRVSAASLVLAWAASGAVSAFVPLILLAERPIGPRTWWYETRALGPRYLVEAVGTVGVFQLMTYVVALVVSVSDAGVFRLSQVVFGPVHVAYGAARAFLTPRLAALKGNLPRRERTMLIRATWSLSFGCLALGALYALLPDPAGERLIGESWPAVQAVLPFVLVQKLLETLGVAPFSLLRARRQVGTTVRVRLWTCAIGVVLCIPAAAVGGLQGELTLLASLSFISVCAWWSHVGLDRPGKAPAMRLRVAVVSHAYNLDSTAASLAAISSSCTVTLLAPRQAKALVFEGSAPPSLRGVQVVALRTLPLPRSQYLFDPIMFGRAVRSVDLLQIEYDPWSLIFWQAMVWRGLSGSQSRVVVVAKKNTFRRWPLRLQLLKVMAARVGLRFVHAIIATSEMTARMYRTQLSWPADRTFVAPHLAIEAAETASPADEHAARVLFVGQVAAFKGVSDLVEAGRLLRQRDFPNLELTVVGPIADVNIAVDEPWITWTGLVDNDEVRKIMTSANVFCMPARRLPDHEEHDGRALLEAMATGLRCVATDSGILPELVDRNFGVIVPPSDAEALAQGIAEAFRLDPVQAGSAARRAALVYAGPEAYATKRLDIYREVMSWQRATST